MKLLPSQQLWVQSVCESLIDGEFVILRGLPGSGKTALLDAVARELADTSVVARGRSFTERNQRSSRESIEQRVNEFLRKYGTAHLLFDDYPHALQRSQGLRLQRLLLHLLVDGDRAVDVGALLTGRWARSMHLVSSGSPLIPRARLVHLPLLGEVDFKVVGDFTPMEVSATVGGNAALLAKLTSFLGKPSLHQVREAAELLAPSWVQDAPWDAVRWMKRVVRNGPAPLPDDSLAAEALAPLVFAVDSESYDVVQALRSPQALAELDGRAPTWPANWTDAVTSFCALLDAAPTAVWVDRYLAVDPPSLLRFIQDVRRTCPTRLHILVARDQAKKINTSVIAAFTALDCEIRTMHPGDRKQLHDRHLIFRGGRRGGVVMPTGRVILCQDPPGAAMAVHAPLLDQQLIFEAWNRGGVPC